MADELVIASKRDLEAVLTKLARAQRMVFFAGLLGVGKSLLIRELALAVHAAGRTVHLLQWDVARPAVESTAVRARYPEHDGIAHPVIRKAVGQWARGAILRWHREQPGEWLTLTGGPACGGTDTADAGPRCPPWLVDIREAPPVSTGGAPTQFGELARTAASTRCLRPHQRLDFLRLHPATRSWLSL